MARLPHHRARVRVHQVALTVAFILLAAPAVAQDEIPADEPQRFDPIAEAEGLVFTSSETIGKTPGRANYVKIAVREVIELSTGATEYYVAFIAGYPERTKYLTQPEAASVARIIESLRDITDKTGSLNAETARYAVDNDLLISKIFNSQLHRGLDRGAVSVGLYPYVTTADLNEGDLYEIASLLQQAQDRIDDLKQ